MLTRTSRLMCTTAGKMPRQPLAARSVVDEVLKIEAEWRSNPRWSETTRPYSAEDVVALQGSVKQTFGSDMMAKKLYATLLDCRATGGPRTNYFPVGKQLRVDPQLHQFVTERVLPGTAVTADTFWSGLDDIVSSLGPKNAFLLRKRDTIQSQLDDFHRSHPGASPDLATLENMGYVVPAVDTKVVTKGIDDEIARIAGPQLVCPIDNKRLIINAANARWGSLLDSLFSTNAVVAGADARRGAVFDAANELLDELFPLGNGSWADVTCLNVECGALTVQLAYGPTSLQDAKQFVGFSTGEDDFCSRQSLLLKRNGLHVELVIDRGQPLEHKAGLVDINIESAISTICDMEDSACAVDAEDKVLAYSNWLGLMDRSISAPIVKQGKQLNRCLASPRVWTTPDGGTLTLPGQSLLLARNVGLHMYTDAVVTSDGAPIPEHFVDALVTAAAALHDVQGHHSNSRTGSIYIVKPKMHGPEECALAVELFGAVERVLGLPQNSIKIGVMDEERRTSVNLAATMHEAKERLFFVNTGFLDRTADEIHTSMQAGAVLPKDAIKAARWYGAYEENNVVNSLSVDLVGKGQIGKGMWAAPDDMEAMLAQKGSQIEAGASTGWVPSPVAATLHALHYLRRSVPTVQQAMLTSLQQQGDAAAARREALRDTILEPPLMRAATLSLAEVQAELENNVQGLLGYVVRWVGQGIGCSKVPNLDNVQLMEDRATLRISSQHIGNWMHHGVVSRYQVLDTLRRVAALVDAQNAGDGKYRPMAPGYDSPEWHAAVDLIFKAVEEPNGYTEATLSHWRRARKAEERASFEAGEDRC